MLALSRDELNIGTEDDLFRIRRHVGKAARAQAFDLFATAAITTATAELARHVLLHARPGTATVEVISDGDRNGLRVTLRGQTGPDRQRRPEVRRLVDELAVDGGTVTFSKWKHP